MTQADEPVSAQVVLAQLGRAEEVRAHFDAAGFETDHVVGTSFAIAAPASRFSEAFGASADRGPRELPLTSLPAALRPAVEAIVIPGPPRFGSAG